MIELAAAFAVAGAASNAVGTAFQRKAASASRRGGVRLLSELVRRPAWLLGMTLFGERVRTGWWLLPEVCGAVMIVTGVLALSRAVQGVTDRPPGPSGPR
ncbi:hypothetical protein QQY24_29080 [Streptomyces sp. TG1A-8]|uniref:hypothetical protein n=1 Tax=Streptomyces sp. TG1A-8 TaxID=3051385 RepID=UPI00265BEEE5|nr:hypothetical protein [Streptomyces sp. TG1A-8]MDO0929268.1 hypothetical protein [Streptomyces sp. TG1A-8]